jgi:hypothetical protein
VGRFAGAVDEDVVKSRASIRADFARGVGGILRVPLSNRTDQQLFPINAETPEFRCWLSADSAVCKRIKKNSLTSDADPTLIQVKFNLAAHSKNFQVQGIMVVDLHQDSKVVPLFRQKKRLRD